MSDNILPFVPKALSAPQRPPSDDAAAVRVELAEAWDVCATLMENVVSLGTARLEGRPLRDEDRQALQALIDQARTYGPQLREMVTRFRNEQ